MRPDSAKTRIAQMLKRIREQPPEAQEAFKWSMLMGLADAGWLEFIGVQHREGKEVYQFQEPSSGERLAAIRPDISPELEGELRENLLRILQGQ